MKAGRGSLRGQDPECGGGHEIPMVEAGTLLPFPWKR